MFRFFVGLNLNRDFVVANLSHNRLLQCCSAAISLLKLVCKLLHNHTNTRTRTHAVFYPFVLFFALLGFVLIMVLGKGS